MAPHREMRQMIPARSPIECGSSEDWPKTDKTFGIASSPLMIAQTAPRPELVKM
jgi:hypothetical protein